MARFTRNSDDQKSEDSRSGWRSRREAARARRLSRQGDRAEIAAIRAAHLQTARAAEETGFNPEVRTGAQAPGDFITAMSDADLAAYYQQLIGRPPHHKAKRPAIEKAVRQAEADRAKIAAEAEPLELNQIADDDMIEGDEQ